jgi:hypothetical protein
MGFLKKTFISSKNSNFSLLLTDKQLLARFQGRMKSFHRDIAEGSFLPLIPAEKLSVRKRDCR